jgi:hypothetical protein
MLEVVETDGKEADSAHCCDRRGLVVERFGGCRRRKSVPAEQLGIGRWSKPMARKRIRHIVAIVAGLLLNALVDAVVEEVLSALLKHLF